MANAHALGAAGLGLYRTEFLFLQRNELPDEEEQFLTYRDAVLGMSGRPVTIRTLDLGADKADRTGLVLDNEENPALGLRGVRLSLANGELFDTQLRAIVRASGYGPVRVLVPMVSNREEMVAVRKRLKRVADQAAQAGRGGRRRYPAGGDDRSARRGDRLARLRRCRGFPLGRHQRPGPIPAGRGPQQRCPGRTLFAR